MPEVRDLLMTAVSVGRIVLRHSNRIEEGIGSRSRVLGADLFKISRTVFLETGMKDSSGTPLKGLSKECEAQGCESRSDQILLILF